MRLRGDGHRDSLHHTGFWRYDNRENLRRRTTTEEEEGEGEGDGDLDPDDPFTAPF